MITLISLDSLNEGKRGLKFLKQLRKSISDEVNLCFHTSFLAAQR